MGKHKKRTFTVEIKQEAVRLTETSGRTIIQVDEDTAKELTLGGLLHDLKRTTCLLLRLSPFVCQRCSRIGLLWNLLQNRSVRAC